jgi:hypothetical protein
MRRIPLPTESYQHQSKPLSSKRLLNFMAEQEPSDARSEVALVSTAGLEVSYTVGTGPVLAMNSDLPGIIYLVSGSHFFRMTFNETTTPPVLIEDLGDVGAAAGLYGTVTIAVGVSAAVVCISPNAFTCAHTGPINQLGGTFPASGAGSVAYLDGYFVFSTPQATSQFFICGLMDPSSFDALDFAYADAEPNVINRVISHRGDIWLIGSTIEVWYDSGDADFPFRRRPGGVIPNGSHFPNSVATADMSVFWVGFDNIVYRSAGYLAKRVSTHAVEFAISQHLTKTAMGVSYAIDGHVFYALCMDDLTLVYDCATQQWHNRSSTADGTGPWRIMAAARFPLLLGDRYSGNLYNPNSSIGTDNGVYVLRQATLPPLYPATRRGFCARLEVEMETGGAVPPGTITLDWSDDGGNNFTGGPRAMSGGAPSEFRRRVYATRLGSFRERMFRMSANAKVTVYAVDADIVAGNS